MIGKVERRALLDVNAPQNCRVAAEDSMPLVPNGRRTYHTYPYWQMAKPIPWYPSIILLHVHPPPT